MNDVRPAPATPGKGSRYLFMVLLGLVIGAAGTAYLMRMWLGKPDSYDHAVMQLMGIKNGHLNEALRANRCSASDALPALQTMRALANEIEPAFADLRDDARFVQHADQLRARLDAAIATPPQDCAALKQTAARLKDTCEACHRDFGH